MSSGTRLHAAPGTLDFGTLADDLALELSNAGGDDEVLRVNDVQATTEDGGSWLSAAPAAVDANGLGSWRVRVDRGALGAFASRFAFCVLSAICCGPCACVANCCWRRFALGRGLRLGFGRLASSRLGALGVCQRRSKRLPLDARACFGATLAAPSAPPHD